MNPAPQREKKLMTTEATPTPRTEGLTTGPPADLDNANAKPIFGDIQAKFPEALDTDQDLAAAQHLQDIYGVRYWQAGEVDIYESPPNDTYVYTGYIGAQEVTVPNGASAWTTELLEDGTAKSRILAGPTEFFSKNFTVVIYGRREDEQSRTLRPSSTVLPYVNGCSTKQVFAPDRPGDPTLQYLHIPPFSAEQAHHIHPTVRAVLVWQGHGTSIVGMDDNVVREELKPGMVCILEPMCPHHFETPFGVNLEVLPVHVYSTVPGSEANHPMFNGTFVMSQS